MYTYEQLKAMTSAQRRAVIARLQEEILESLGATATPTPMPEPEPQPTVEPAPVFKLPTAKMRQSLARFDDLADADQVDYLTTLWGQS